MTDTSAKNEVLHLCLMMAIIAVMIYAIADLRGISFRTVRRWLDGERRPRD